MKSLSALAFQLLTVAALISCTDPESMTCNGLADEIITSSNEMVLNISEISTLPATDESHLECRGIAETRIGANLAIRFRMYRDGDGNYQVESTPDLPWTDQPWNSFADPGGMPTQPIDEDANIDMYDNGDGRSIVEQGGRPCIGRWFHSYKGGRVAIALRDDGTANIEPSDEPAVEGTFRLAGDGVLITVSEPLSSYDGTSRLEDCGQRYTTLRTSNSELSLAKW